MISLIYFLYTCRTTARTIILYLTLIEQCVDKDNGAYDVDGDSCEYYTDYPDGCGWYDDEDFNSLAMCCACKATSSQSGKIIRDSLVLLEV